jgi:hypothetical protein
MNHQEAVMTQAAERYLLKEMSAAEVEQFELHYFDCFECARAVETGMELVENSRAVFAENEADLEKGRVGRDSRAPFWSGWLNWWRQPAFALASALAVAMGGVAFYQGMIVIPAARQAALQAQPAIGLSLLAATRGQVEETAVPAGTSSLVLSAVLPPDARYPRYRWVLESDGRIIGQAEVSAPRDGQALLVSVPVRGLRTATYQLTVFGLADQSSNGDKIDVYPFRLRFPN